MKEQKMNFYGEFFKVLVLIVLLSFPRSSLATEGFFPFYGREFIMTLIAQQQMNTLSETVDPNEFKGIQDIEKRVQYYKEALATARDNREKVILHKQLGDLYVSQEGFDKAAEQFIQALSHRDEFSEKERTQMAIYISWGNRLDEASKELKAIISENPGNSEARIHLARTLSWAGEFDESLAETDALLAEFPNQRDALLIKANVLNWRGENDAAISLYQNLIKEKDDFDTRLGMTYALLSANQLSEAKKSYNLLTPSYEYQNREFIKLQNAIEKATKPYFDLRYNYYDDTDDNRYHRYMVMYSFILDRWRINLNYRYTDAWDDIRNDNAHELSTSAYGKLTESMGAGGGLGVAWTGDDDRLSDFTWNLRIDKDLFKGKIGANISREIFADTAELIENNMRVTNSSLYITQDFNSRFSLYGSYSYRDYSDDNNSNDLQFIPRYTFLVNNPQLVIGYRLRYLNFNRHSGSGYFDPKDFMSHQVFSSVYAKRKKFYVYAEPYIGYQSFRRNGENNHDWVTGAYGSLGWNITESVVFEVSAEGGNYALETASGFRYFLVGTKLIFPFPL